MMFWMQRLTKKANKNLIFYALKILTYVEILNNFWGKLFEIFASKIPMMIVKLEVVFMCWRL
jgi:hypothetical protein